MANTRITRVQGQAIGGGASTRVTRVRVWAIIPADTVISDEVEVTDQVTIQLITVNPFQVSIQDLAGNPLSTQTSPMIGFVSAEALTSEDLSLRIYLFILETIRIEDQDSGNQFLERYLEGAQADWFRVRARINSIRDLWSIVDIEDEFLQFLKWIVGWTSELDSITDELDAATLRRLIAASVPFWRQRGPEDAIRDILRLTTGARLRIWNWFDFRIVADETAMGEELQGFDPWMIALPGPPTYDENRYNIRIVDDGTLNKALVRDLARLTRPSGERVEISYISFLDLFQVDDDNSQWTDEEDPFGSGDGLSISTVANGAMTVAPTTPGDQAESYVSVDGANDWRNYTVTYRAKGADWVASFYRTAQSDMYGVQVLTTTNRLALFRVIAGVPTTIVSVDMLAAFTVELKADVYYAIRVEAIPESGQTRIRVYFDANLAIDVLDASHVEGSIGIGHGSSGSVDLAETELFFNPLQSDTIDINT